MNYIFGILGLVVGIFLWSSIWGTLFATLPLRLKLKNDGEIESVKWPTLILGPIVFASVVLLLSYIYLTPFFYGSVIAGLVMLTQIGNLKREAVENYLEEKNNKQKSTKKIKSSKFK